VSQYLGPIRTAKQAAEVRERLLAKGMTAAAALLTGGRWRSAAARPALALELMEASR
jgi:hypothetical protein